MEGDAGMKSVCTETKSEEAVASLASMVVTPLTLTSTPTSADYQFHQEGNTFINMAIQGLPASDQQLEMIKTQQQQDKVCQQIKACCDKGWPDRQALPEGVKPYYPVSTEISVQSRLHMHGSRIIISVSMRLSIS